MSAPRPNLFDYGHKELSQDAVICWLMDWANLRYREIDPALHHVGQAFVRALFRKHGRDAPDIHDVQLGMQVSRIDVLAWINNEYAILIEDKTYTWAHGKQLEDYHARVLKGDLEIGSDSVRVNPSKESFFPIFLKTGNMPVAGRIWIENRPLCPPYRVFERTDFLGILNRTCYDRSPILADFKSRLQRMERLTNSWASEALDSWSWEAWEGFYRRLEEEHSGESGEMDWGYVPIGDFLALWWCSRSVAEDELYLQVEQDRLCFKIAVRSTDSGTRRDLRTRWHERVMQASERHNMQCTAPGRFGNGNTMTVAVLPDWRPKTPLGTLDWEATRRLLEKAEQTVDTAVNMA